MRLAAFRTTAKNGPVAGQESISCCRSLAQSTSSSQAGQAAFAQRRRLPAIVVALTIALILLGSAAFGDDPSPREETGRQSPASSGDSVRVIQLDTLRADNRPVAAYCTSLNISFFASLSESPLWWASRVPAGLRGVNIPAEHELHRLGINELMRATLAGYGGTIYMPTDYRHIYSEFRTFNPAFNPSLLTFDVTR
jgi:hypothetical protein